MKPGRLSSAHSAYNFKRNRNNSSADFRLTGLSAEGEMKNAVWGKVYQFGDINAKRSNYKKLHKSRPSEIVKEKASRLAEAMHPNALLHEANTLLSKPKRSFQLISKLHEGESKLLAPLSKES